MEIDLSEHMEETLFTIVIWIGLWGIFEHVIRIYCKSMNSQIMAYVFLVIFGYFMLYSRNHIHHRN
jgi:hypothetical protein